MDPKRELTSVDLAALVGELGAYEGAKVDKAYLYGDDLVRLKMRDFDRGRVELLLEVGETKRAHTVAPERVPDAPGRPPQFAMMLRNRLSGADFAGVEQYEFDRILEFVFEREDGTTRIIVELFGQGNVAVTDGEYEVIDCLETVRLKSRTVVPGSRYEFPDSRTNPLTVSREAFDREMEDSDTDVVRTLATQLNFGGLYAEEICTRAGVEKAMDIAEADEDVYDRIYGAIERLALDLRNGNFDPRLYVADDDGDEDESESGDENGDDSSSDRVVDATPFPLEEHVELASEPYDSFLAALDDYFYRLELADDEEETDPTTQRPDFEEEIAKYERIIEQQRGAIEGFEQEADALREQAELLYAEYGLVDDILSTVQEARAQDRPWDEIEERFAEGADRGIAAAEAVVNVDGSEGTVTVELDGERIDLVAKQGVEQNADRLYTEAKRVGEKKEGALAAIEDTREDLGEAKARRDRWEEADAADEGEDDEDDEGEERDWLSEPSVPIRENEPWFDRFRWFHTSDGYLVIGGRNADQNEELVKKYLEPGDKVLHTQAHGGPVTVLKATDPSEASSSDIELPDSSIEEAAQFAVSYSSVWKDGRYAGDVYAVDSDQVTKTPESGEYLEKGGFAIRGDRTYYRDTPVDVAVGIQCAPYTRVIGGPPSAIEGQAVTTIEIEPGRYAQADAAKRLYRRFRERFEDESFVRKIASPDRIQHFMPPGGSRISEE
ncbi:Fibronectin-binding A domain protein [Haloterrigena turkmenica DSM 5511]|uniref:Archaeal Rqc2 homolog aRqcH n=1 Tax=Haloterrigena turkmenica (strain ATCC 51198 / DSM 5511 / JCM 9101 / NCIMB 13204 / VKM B-1734 / 4k) TaxID=543526 RepID=D2RXJ8_HALTV|nr:ribosome rescue protein RqcH [Haloterrigena turkmenica]ADB61722.1 Fibronectin-binding A domain protein [Haloterrigena turkmenica DSM 5511]